MRWYTVDYRKDREELPRSLVNKGFWIHDLPRLMPLCRLLGHKPVVDGVNMGTHGEHVRWVCCDRCGVRPDNQGRLDPSKYKIGQRYTGPYGPPPPAKCARTERTHRQKGEFYLPGPWPATPAGTVGGQLVLGKSIQGFSVDVTVGCAGGEHALSGHIRLNPLGALYLHADHHGTWLQRRLVATGYDDREIGLSIDHTYLSWKLWARQGHWSSDDPKWMQGSININPLDRILGEARYSYEDVGERVDAIVRMPHGDDHTVQLQLRRQTHGRNRGRKRLGWTVSWESEPGIPVRWDDGWKGGNIYASGVDVTDGSVQAGSWPFEAAAKIASAMMRDRVHYRYTPEREANRA
jgi:hypothetical protein